jgi:GntR family transcriptional regulator
MNLRFHITPGNPTPIWRQIVDQVRAAIASGELSAHDALPSVRAVAASLVVNANTVAKAYAELTRHGDVVSEAGRGLFVATEPPSLPGLERRKKLQLAVERVVTEAVHLGVTRAALVDAIDRHCDKHDLLPREHEARDDD